MNGLLVPHQSVHRDLCSPYMHQHPPFLALCLRPCDSVSLICFFQSCPINLSVLFPVSFLLGGDIRSFVVSFTISHGFSQLWPTLLRLLLNSCPFWVPCQLPVDKTIFSPCHSSTHATVPFLLGVLRSPSPSGFSRSLPNSILAHDFRGSVFQVSSLHKSTMECEPLHQHPRNSVLSLRCSLHRHRKE